MGEAPEGEIQTSLSDKTLPLKNIKDPQDTDVLCGRGGAALRHPGNQTYRRLVHLNKGLYITCLKAEKLKISRSIVAAIREQNGRFLERDTKSTTWYDIGDKKAMEKTSQALREGQPKLRQKIVELGGGAAGAAALLESQFPGSNVYQASQATGVMTPEQRMAQQQQQQQQQAAAVAQAAQQQAAAAQSLGVPPETISGEMLHRMSLTETSIAEEPMNFSAQLRNSLIGSARSSLQGSVQDLNGIEQSTYSLMSDISNFGITDSTFSLESRATNMGSFVSRDMPPPPPPPPGQFGTPGSLAANSLAGSLTSSMAGSMVSKDTSGAGKSPFGLDRRKYFARMKYSRPPSSRASAAGSDKGIGSRRSVGTDGMPDVTLVDSQPSLFSDISSSHHFHQLKKPNDVPDVVANIFESRRSVMSGLSRISDTSEGNSIFSDLSKKIGDVSTRSLAMSEISNMDGVDTEDEDEDEDDESVDTERMPATITSIAQSMDEM